MTIIRSVPRVIDVRQSEAKNDSRSGSQFFVQVHRALGPKS
ncbi:MAG: hypothetical protein WBD83_26590 [Xanthobacteraceae bacterium]